MTGSVPSDHVALLVNGGSRRGANAYVDTLRGLEAAGLHVTRSVLMADPAQIADEVAAAVETGCRLLVVGAGDGTIGAVAGLVADLPPARRPVLGVVPLGTANDFARTLGLKPGAAAAVSVLATGKVVDIDLGRANGAAFVNAATLGLSIGATEALRPGLKRWLGPGAYPVSVISAYRRHQPFDARLEFPGSDREPLEMTDLMQVTIANGRHYGGGNTVAPDAGIDDATLDVQAIRTGRVQDHLSVAWLLRNGTLVHHEHVEHLVTPAVTVTTDHAQPVSLDGEIAAATPVAVTVQRNALEVVVPQHVDHVRHEGGKRDLRAPGPASAAGPDGPSAPR